jgi:hypothetical protein
MTGPSKKFLRIDPNSNSRLKESVIYKVVKLGDGIFGLLALKDIRKDIKALAEFKMHYAANKIIIEATPMKLTKLLDAKKFKRLVKGFEHARHSQRVERLSQAYGMGTVRLNNKKVKELIGATFEAQWDVVGFANNVRGWADELGDTETYAKADSLHAGAKAWTKAMNKEILQWLSLQRGKPISHEEIERRWDRLH